MVAKKPCLFCQIVTGQLAAAKVFEDEAVVCFLDHRPVFKGHVLIVPRAHIEVLGDLPATQLPLLFGAVQRIAAAVERALPAGGTFVAMNNRVSQSVPHLHVHVVPRNKGDGLKGFFWPRVRYGSNEEINDTRSRIAAALLGGG